MCPRSSLQFGSGGERNTTPPGLHSPHSSQDTIMDETPSDEGTSGETEREPGTSDRLLFEGLCLSRERLISRLCDSRRQLLVEHPDLAESLSSIIRISVRLGRIEQLMLCVDSDEDAPFEGLNLNEEDD